MPEVSIVVGVYNEAPNVAPLIAGVEKAFADLDWEVIFVDDNSPDGTADVVRAIAQANPRIRLNRRIGERGLASACVRGWLGSTAPVLAVMDGDLQHDPKVMRQLVDQIRAGDTDLACASRFLDSEADSGTGGLRAMLSTIGNGLARMVIKAPLTDPMSGMFAMRREYFYEAAPYLSAVGFKILLDVVASAPNPPRLKQVHAPVAKRVAGESKLDALVSAELLGLIVDKATRGVISPRMALFLMVGFTGMGVHAVTLGMLYRAFGVDFLHAQTAALVIAMTSNYFLNNILTFRDVRRHGMGVFWGLLAFYIACSVGAAISLKSSEILLHDLHAHWLVAGLGGAVLASVWNYGASSVLAWRRGLKPLR